MLEVSQVAQTTEAYISRMLLVLTFAMLFDIRHDFTLLPPLPPLLSWFPCKFAATHLVGWANYCVEE